MRNRVIGLILAALLSAGGALALPARPAAAVVDIPGIIKTIEQIYGYWKQFQGFLGSGGGSGLTLEQATQEIIGAIHSSQQQIIDQIDQLATAQAQACASDAVIEFADIDSFSPNVLQQWAQNATSCVTLIQSLWNAMPGTNYAALDKLGFALGSVGPIALIARAKAGFSTTALTAVQVQVFKSITLSLGPWCWEQDQMLWPDEEYPNYPVYHPTTYACQAPSSDGSGYAAADSGYAWWFQGVYDDQSCGSTFCGAGSPDFTNINGRDLTRLATQYTSREIALTVLPGLQA